jgi:hypothetical protein
MTRTPQNLSTPPEISIFGDRAANPSAQKRLAAGRERHGVDLGQVTDRR